MSSLNEVMNNANIAQVAWRDSEQRLETARNQYYAALEATYHTLKTHAHAQSVVILTTIKQAQAVVETPKESVPAYSSSSSSSPCTNLVPK